MYPVAGYPNISIVTGSKNGLTANSNQIAQVTVTAVGNTVNLLQLPITISHLSSATTSNLTVQVAGSNTTVATSSTAAFNGTTGAGTGAATLTFTNGGYQIIGGATVTFNIFADVANIATGNGSGSDGLTTQLGAAGLVLWGDVNGGSGNVLTAQYIPSYST